MTGKTLKELDVKPGDVVEWWDEKCGGDKYAYTVAIGKYGFFVDASDGGRLSQRPNWRIISRASDTPKLWRDMTSEEKGALLLAHHEGRAIEGRNKTWPVDDWATIIMPSWHNDSAYRIRPEPKVYFVTQHWKTDCNGNFVPMSQLAPPVGATHRITFTTIDGIPDTISIKMEKL